MANRGRSLSRVLIGAVVGLAVVVPATGSSASDSAGVSRLRIKGEARSGPSRFQRSPVMTYHGGKIMPTAVTKAIFWGSSWPNATSAGDKIAGLDSWYTGFSGSNYAKTSDEYTDTVNGVHQVGATTTYQGHVVDPSAASGGSNTSVILAEVAKTVTAPDPNGYYPVYTDVPRGNANYCAWHSVGTVAGVQVQFAFFFRLDGDPGCDPVDTTTGHSQGLAALANVSAHELSEATFSENHSWNSGSARACHPLHQTPSAADVGC